MYSDARQTGRLLAKNSRPQNIVYSGLLAAGVAYLQHASLGAVLLCYLLVLLLYSFAVSINNVADVWTDTLNQRVDNPLVGNQLSQTALRSFVLVCGLAILGIQFLLAQPLTIMTTCTSLLLSYVYSSSALRVQSRGLWGTALLCTSYGAVPLFLGLAQGSEPITTDTVLVAVLVTLLLSPLLLAKDYKDLKGDKQTGKNTPLVRYGAARLQRIAQVLIVVSVIAYGSLAMQYDVNAYTILISTTLYIGLLLKIHHEFGRTVRVFKTALLAVLLIMPVSVLMQV